MPSRSCPVLHITIARMPLKKSLSLSDLCLENIVENIVAHSAQFRKAKRNVKGEIYAAYKTCQFLSSDTLLEKFVEVYENVDSTKFGRLLNLSRFLLFNEYTTSVFGETIKNVPKPLFSHIASNCKNLKSLRLQELQERRSCTFFNDLQYLQVVDLGFNCTDMVLGKLFEKCPFIRKITACAVNISDNALLSLCKHGSQKEFIYCRENGVCSAAGKHLEILHLGGSRVTAAGVACALQHLPHLKELMDPLRPSFLPPMLMGIFRLQNDATANGMAPIMLELTHLYFSKPLTMDIIRTVIFCCPKVKSVSLDLIAMTAHMLSVFSFRELRELYIGNFRETIFLSSEFQQFLSTHCENISVLTFHNGNFNADILRLEHFHHVLTLCHNLKHLEFSTLEIDDRYDLMEQLPSCVTKLERIELPVTCSGMPEVQYFYKLLCMAKNVKSLSCFQGCSEFLPGVLQVNSFSRLEELSLFLVDLAELGLESLITASNNLRQMTFESCYFSDSDGNVVSPRSEGVRLCCRQFKILLKNRNYVLKINYD